MMKINFPNYTSLNWESYFPLNYTKNNRFSSQIPITMTKYFSTWLSEFLGKYKISFITLDHCDGWMPAKFSVP